MTDSCWVDNINPLSLVRLIGLKLRYGFRRVAYLKISESGHKFIKLFKLERFFEFNSIRLRACGMSSGEEQRIYYDSKRQSAVLAAQIIKETRGQKSLSDMLDRRYDQAKIALFFEQEIAAEIEPFLLLSNFLEWFCSRGEEAKPGRDIALIKNTLWVKQLAVYKQRDFGKVFTYPDLKKSLEFFFIPLKMILEISANFLAVIFGGAEKINYGKNAASVAVLYAHGADLKKRADCFWFLGSAIDPGQVLIYFRYPCWPLTEEITALIRSYNMRWIDLLPWQPRIFKRFFGAPEFFRLRNFVYVRKAAKAFFESSRLLLWCFLRPSKLAFWQWRCLSDLLDRVAFYEAFFELYNIKVHYSLYEMGRDMTASNIAINLAGGLDLAHHWSNYDRAEIAIGKPHDVYFAWGPYYGENFFSQDYYRLKYLVYTGYPYDCYFPAYKDEAARYRRRLLEKGARFIITFFDQTYPADWPKANQNVEAIYRAFLTKVLNDPRIGLITKPKKFKEFWQKMPALALLAKAAQDSGRCLFLERSVFPNVAAQAADLTVGFGVYSTPALEAALSGKKAITCDLQDFREHPFYPTGANSIVFNDLGAMFSAIDDFIDNKSGAGFGDYAYALKDMFRDIDPFQDGQASRRIGGFIKQLLDEFNRGVSAPDALSAVRQAYQGRWGRDKVVDCVRLKDVRWLREDSKICQ